MSKSSTQNQEDRQRLRESLASITEPHTTSRQAGNDANAHADGEAIHQHFGVQPLYRYLWLNSQRSPPAAVTRYLQAFVDSVVYLEDRDIEVLRDLAGEVRFDPDLTASEPQLAETYRNPYRQKLFEWIAADERRVNQLRSVGGTDMLIHGEPGGGKTTLGLSLAMWRMQVNNETVIWAESVDESGTNERTEWLPMAPFATVCLPAGLGDHARLVPRDPGIADIDLDIEAICRDVIRYESVQDLVAQLEPGQFYVIFPDPLHRGCREVSDFAYHSFQAVTPEGMDGPDRPTPADHWWFALAAHRISGDAFTHPTFINLDEAGNLLDSDAQKDDHDHYQKIRWFRDKYADARKKGVSFAYQTHALSELHRFARQKIRWRVTMNGSAPPIGRQLPGDRRCPLESDLTSSLQPGQAVSWKNPHFAEIRWPNLKGEISLDAEVSIDFQRWQEAI